MEKANFFSWFTKLFIPAVQDLLSTGPVVLFFDGHHSHLSLKLLQEAKVRNVHLVCLPAHTSHILQPMDVSVYGPMKATWRTILKKYKTSTRAANVTKEVFPSLLNHLWAESVCPEHITAGFKASGLHPINARAIPSYKIAPSIAITSTDNQEISSSCSAAKETPLRTELRHFFAAQLQPLPNAPKAKKKRVKLHMEGEALSNEEVMEYLRQQEEQKKAAKKGRKKSKSRPKQVATQEEQITPEESNVQDELITESVSDEDEDTSHCFKCSGAYDDSQVKEWIGCDTCYRWYHYKCVGFKRLPKVTTRFSCHLCHELTDSLFLQLT